MDIIKQNRFLTGITIFLVILNIAGLTTILIGRPKHPRPKMMTGQRDITHVKDLLRKELAFDDSQIARYLELRKEQQQRIRELKRQMHAAKQQLFAQALLENAQATPPDSLLAILSGMQLEVEKVTYQHLRTLSLLCAPGQRGKLEHQVRNLIGNRPPGPGGPPPGHDRPGPPAH